MSEIKGIKTAPRDGTVILVHFKRHGWVSVFWSSPYYDQDEVTIENGIWCVDDFKHGPYSVRGYSDGDDTHWTTLPDNPL